MAHDVKKSFNLRTDPHSDVAGKDIICNSKKALYAKLCPQ